MTRTLYESRCRLWHAPSQRYRYVVARATPLLHPDGTVREWVGTCMDIEDQTRLEAELRDADRRKDEFLATLGHELRNPLAPIRHAVDILNLQGPPDPIVQAARDIIGRQVAHMVRLIDDLLDVSRITRGRLDLRRERVELAAVVDQALDAVRPDVESAGHDLTVTLPPEPIVLDADPVRLAQVFSNLLHNACKYTEPGGRIRLTAEGDGADEEDRRKSHAAGFDAHLVKPVDRTALMQLLASLRPEQSGLPLHAEVDQGRHAGFAWTEPGAKMPRL